eukprot:2123514-Pyramimonas_sp.AAC.1
MSTPKYGQALTTDSPRARIGPVTAFRAHLVPAITAPLPLLPTENVRPIFSKPLKQLSVVPPNS